MLLLHYSSGIYQKLPDPRLGNEGCLPERVIICANIDPSDRDEAVFFQDLVDTVLDIAVKKKGAYGQVVYSGQRKPQFAYLPREIAPRYLDKNARAVAGLAVGADRAAMRKVLDRLYAPRHYLPASLAMHITGKPDAAARQSAMTYLHGILLTLRLPNFCRSLKLQIEQSFVDLDGCCCAFSGCDDNLVMACQWPQD